METSEQRSEARAWPSAENRPPMGILASSRILRSRDLQRYRACENGTAGLIFFMVVFSPWAFGTTQPWAIRTMDAAGYLLGLLLALKLWVRWRKGYRPARWGRHGRRDERTTEVMDWETQACKAGSGHRTPATNLARATTSAPEVRENAPISAQLEEIGRASCRERV